MLFVWKGILNIVNCLIIYFFLFLKIEEIYVNVKVIKKFQLKNVVYVTVTRIGKRSED